MDGMARSEGPRRPAEEAVDRLLDQGFLDELMDRVDEGGVQLTGEGGFLPELVKRVLEAGLQAKLTGHLGYEKHDPAGRGSGNSRNGSTGKRLGTEVGDLELATPRDRNGTFDPRLVPKGQRRVGGLTDMIISLYSGGMTIRDIQSHLERTLGTELSHETIANITDAVAEEVKAWQARPLEPVYPILYLDALMVKVRDNHQVRRKAVAAALRPIYTAPSVEVAAVELDIFEGSTWGKKYPATVRVWRDAWERFIPFLEFLPEVRKIIYTTNSIESLNYQLRKIIKNRGHFPHDDAVVKLLWLAIRDIEDKRARERATEAGRPRNERKAPPKLVEGATVQGWNAAFGALSLAFPGRLEMRL